MKPVTVKQYWAIRHTHRFKSADTWRHIVRGFKDVSRPLQRLNLDKSMKKCGLVVMPNLVTLKLFWCPNFQIYSKIQKFSWLEWYSISHSLTMTPVGCSQGCHCNLLPQYWKHILKQRSGVTCKNQPNVSAISRDLCGGNDGRNGWTDRRRLPLVDV